MNWLIKALNTTQLLCLVICSCEGQGNQPLSWKFDSYFSKSDELTITLSATLSPGWHIYSHYIDEGGPTPTAVNLNPSQKYEVVDSLRENGPRTKFHDEVYDMDIVWYTGNIVFEQKVRLLDFVSTISGNIEYMTCNDHLCIPYKEEFSILVNKPQR